ncbi:hypothetical protein VCHC64A1_00236A, partial [Vibrio cholerae HC-64A1]
MRLLLGKR